MGAITDFAHLNYKSCDPDSFVSDTAHTSTIASQTTPTHGWAPTRDDVFDALHASYACPNPTSSAH